MKIEDAIREFKVAKDSIDWSTFVISQDAFDLALTALYKQFPVKPVASEYKTLDGICVETECRCPECGRYICDESEEDHEAFHECCACGQRIDWSDADA